MKAYNIKVEKKSDYSNILKNYPYFCRSKKQVNLSEKSIKMEQQSQSNIEIELTEETAQGIYSNLAVIAHSSSEFVVDFVRLMPGIPKAKVKSRIILTPEHTKRLMLALIENVKKYESQMGEIKLPQSGINPPIVVGPMGEA